MQNIWCSTTKRKNPYFSDKMYECTSGCLSIDWQLLLLCTRTDKGSTKSDVLPNSFYWGPPAHARSMYTRPYPCPLQYIIKGPAWIYHKSSTRAVTQRFSITFYTPSINFIPFLMSFLYWLLMRCQAYVNFTSSVRRFSVMPWRYAFSWAYAAKQRHDFHLACSKPT